MALNTFKRPRASRSAQVALLLKHRKQSPLNSQSTRALREAREGLNPYQVNCYGLGRAWRPIPRMSLEFPHIGDLFDVLEWRSGKDPGLIVPPHGIL